MNASPCIPDISRREPTRRPRRSGSPYLLALALTLVGGPPNAQAERFHLVEGYVQEQESPWELVGPQTTLTGWFETGPGESVGSARLGQTWPITRFDLRAGDRRFHSSPSEIEGWSTDPAANSDAEARLSRDPFHEVRLTLKTPVRQLSDGEEGLTVRHEVVKIGLGSVLERVIPGWPPDPLYDENTRELPVRLLVAGDLATSEWLYPPDHSACDFPFPPPAVEEDMAGSDTRGVTVTWIAPRRVNVQPPGTAACSLSPILLGDRLERFDFVAQQDQSIDIALLSKPKRRARHPAFRRKLKIAILGSSDFDVRDIDLDSLELLPTGASIDAAARPRRKARTRDVNRDGFADLVLRFRKTGIAMTDTEVCLVGATHHETFFSGCHEISPAEPLSRAATWWHRAPRWRR